MFHFETTDAPPASPAQVAILDAIDLATTVGVIFGSILLMLLAIIAVRALWS